MNKPWDILLVNCYGIWFYFSIGELVHSYLGQKDSPEVFVEVNLLMLT